MQRDATQGRDRAVDGFHEGDAATLAARNRQTIRRVSWSVLRGVPIVALVIGIWLSAAGTIEQLTPAGPDVFDVAVLAVLAVWPAGLVLVAVGILDVIAAAITT